MNWGECYVDHFARFFGVPVARESYSQAAEDHSIQILAFDKVFDGCRVFASLGLTHYAQEMGQIAEIFAPVDAAWDRVPALVANAMFYMVQEGMQVGWGIGIGGVGRVDPYFEREFRKSAIYLTRPFGLPEGAGIVECNGERGKLYVAFFITETEYDYFLIHGAEAFEDRIEESGIDPYNLARPSCV